ncbi:MAG: hypothetical protein J2P37_32100, partial [Ktedonobacteraceae bacterium]|nr:hypothetical protein [Ktedonobacteraceae bacterium]
DRLFNDRLTDAWDGQELDNYLEKLDRESHQHHIFYPLDRRFRQNRQGIWEAQVERNIEVPPPVRQVLERCKAPLLARWQEEWETPWTGQRVLELLDELAGREAMGGPRAFLYLRSWLLQEPEFTRVGQDYWMLTGQLPEGMRRVRLSVLPQRDARSEREADQETSEAFQALRAKPSQRSMEEQIAVGGEVGKMSASWIRCLQAAHLQEGFIPIPKKVRGVYPPLAPGEGTIFAIRGRWFDDASELWLWVDRNRHRLYGPDLRDLFDRELLDPGTKLQLTWDPECVSLQRIGMDEKIFEEEARLIDLEELKKLRGGVGESYRHSIQTILQAHPQGLTLAELIAHMRQRLQHTVHSGTVRALLSSGGFTRHGQHWFAAPDEAEGTRRLRRALLESLVPPEKITSRGVSHQEFVRSRVETIRGRLREIVELLGQEER